MLHQIRENQMTTDTINFQGHFTAHRVRKNRWDESKGFEWAVGFTPDGIYKSRACRIAEEAGVRYASHRKGYRASDRAMSRFVAQFEAAM
jgi:hypothetical protein